MPCAVRHGVGSHEISLGEKNVSLKKREEKAKKI